MISAVTKRIFALGLVATVAVSQYAYDVHRTKNPPAFMPSVSLSFVKAFDLGLHSAMAGFFWINETIFELPFLKYGFEKYSEDLRLVNELDPKFSFPYYWTVLVLPNTNYGDAVHKAIEIGQRGVRDGDPDWRVSFYLATLYHLYKNDRMNAAKYFDLAAQTPNAPFYIKRFSTNYGIAPTIREQTKQVWLAIYNTADNEEVKERAKAYVTRLEMFDFLEQAVQVYKKRFGKIPDSLDELITRHVLDALPQDPFGFQFKLYDETVGIVK